MQTGDREAFETILAELFGAIDRPLTEAKREAFWKGLAKMSLLELSRCRDAILADLESGESPRSFTVADIWAAKKRLRAQPVHIGAVDDGYRGDAWDIAANRHLYAHMLRAMGARPFKYGLPRQYSFKPGEHCYTGENARCAQVLCRYKAEWCAYMRSIADAANEVHIETQQVAWRELMRRADEEIERTRPPSVIAEFEAYKRREFWTQRGAA